MPSLHVVRLVAPLESLDYGIIAEIDLKQDGVYGLPDHLSKGNNLEAVILKLIDVEFGYDVNTRNIGNWTDPLVLKEFAYDISSVVWGWQYETAGTEAYDWRSKLGVGFYLDIDHSETRVRYIIGLHHLYDDQWLGACVPISYHCNGKMFDTSLGGAKTPEDLLRYTDTMFEAVALGFKVRGLPFYTARALE